MQPARGSELQKRAARLSIVMEDPQMRRPRFHAPRASLAFAEAWPPVLAKTEEGQPRASGTCFQEEKWHAVTMLCTIVSVVPMYMLGGVISLAPQLCAQHCKNHISRFTTLNKGALIRIPKL